MLLNAIAKDAIASFIQILDQKEVSSVGLIPSGVPLASAGCDHWNTMAISLEVCSNVDKWKMFKEKS